MLLPVQDDGGHQNHHIYNSFATLFHQALKPGGVYFIEDLQVSRLPFTRGPPGTPIVATVLTYWVESLLSTGTWAKTADLTDRLRMLPSYDRYKQIQQELSHTGDSAYLPLYKLPLGAKTIECAAQMCAVVKCTADDQFCPDGMAQQPVTGPGVLAGLMHQS